MVFEYCSDNSNLLNSVTLLYLYIQQDNEEKDGELLSILSVCVKNLIIAGSYEDAVKKAESRDVDIFIVDFDLNNEESIEFIKKIHHINPSCSIIVYTGKNDPEHFMKAIDLRVDKYMIKPADPKEIMKSVVSMADYAFTLKKLYYYREDNETRLTKESYEKISSSIDELNNMVSVISCHDPKDCNYVIHSLKEVIDRLKELLKESY